MRAEREKKKEKNRAVQELAGQEAVQAGQEQAGQEAVRAGQEQPGQEAVQAGQVQAGQEPGQSGQVQPAAEAPGQKTADGEKQPASRVEVKEPERTEQQKEAERQKGAEQPEKPVKYIIRTQDVVRSFPLPGKAGLGGEFQALKGISLEIPEQSLTILRGRSGSGKTTLLNILSALDKPTSGRVWLQNQDIARLSERKRVNLRRKKLGFVFQSVSLIPMMSAYENVEFVLRMAGVKKGRRERAEECLKLVGLGSRMNHMPQEMSGGEQQRVAIARAVAHRPSIIFADEPTGELDSATALSVVNLFKQLVAKEGVTIVMTTHDVSLMGAGDRVYELEDGRLI